MIFSKKKQTNLKISSKILSVRVALKDLSCDQHSLHYTTMMKWYKLSEMKQLKSVAKSLYPLQMLPPSKLLLPRNQCFDVDECLIYNGTEVFPGLNCNDQAKYVI